MDHDRRRAFAEQMITTLTGGALSMLVSVGYRTGLFEAAARGPRTRPARRTASTPAGPEG